MCACLDAPLLCLCFVSVMSLQYKPLRDKTFSGHSPVNPCFLFKQFIKLQHLAPRNNVDFEFGQPVVYQPQVVVNVALSIPSHAAAWSPEDEHCVLARVEQLLSAPQHPLQAGVCYDTQAGAPADVLLVAMARCIVHADDAFRAIDLFTPSVPGQLTRAGHQSTGTATHLQSLWRWRAQVRMREYCY